MTTAAEAPTRSAAWARVARIARLAYLIGLGAAAVGLTAAHWHRVQELLDGARLMPIGAAFVASFVLIAMTATLWAASMQMLGHPVRLPEIILANARSLPARYIPIGVGYAIGRVALLRAAGAATAPLAVTAGLEAVISASVALTMGTALLALSGTLPGGPAWIGAALLAAALAASPAVGGPAVTRLAAKRGVALTVNWGGYLRLLAAAAAYWAWAAATFVLYLRAFPAADDISVAAAAGAFMVAWAAGFLTVFAPQGIGVAELGLAALLSAEHGGGFAMVAVFAGYRVVQVARDVLAAAAGEVIATRRAPPRSEPTG